MLYLRKIYISIPSGVRVDRTLCHMQTKTGDRVTNNPFRMCSLGFGSVLSLAQDLVDIGEAFVHDQVSAPLLKRGLANAATRTMRCLLHSIMDTTDRP